MEGSTVRGGSQKREERSIKRRAERIEHREGIIGRRAQWGEQREGSTERGRER
jgi:hypothetical protein